MQTFPSFDKQNALRYKIDSYQIGTNATIFTKLMYRYAAKVFQRLILFKQQLQNQ